MARKRKLFLVAGARPNFMKIAPLSREFAKRAAVIETVVVHSGQHYDYEMSRVFFEQLDIPEPDVCLEVGSGSHAYQTGQVMLRMEELIIAQCPDMVMVVGDVNSTLAAALAAVKLHVPVGHVEAGLRSFDMKMPEEVNRVLTDHISTLLFTTEPAALDNLRAEGIDSGRVHPAGNVMVDELLHNLERLRQRDTAKRMGLDARGLALATIHRPANVDDEASLRKVLAILKTAAERRPVVFPVHPRTGKSIERLGLKREFDAIDNLRPINPLGYLDFMNLLSGAAVILTDSGGAQVEAARLGVPCITLRDVTEHRMTVEQSRNRLVGLDPVAFCEAMDWADQFDPAPLAIPVEWDGKAAGRIVGTVLEHLEAVGH